MNRLLREWLYKAEQDNDAVQTYLQKEGYQAKDWICYHCHQSVEKFLKAALVSQGQGAPRIHDLSALALELGRVPADLRAAIKMLNPLGNSLRYPGAYPTAQDLEDSVATLRAVRAWTYAFVNETPPDLFAPPDFL